MENGITRQDWWRIVAELVGTFFFFFIGFGTILVTAKAPDTTLLIAGIGHGLALAIAITALGHISGAHFNPAVTVSMMVTRNITIVLGLLYIVAQLVGGVLSLLALKLVVPAAAYPDNLGVPSLGPGVGYWQAVVFEAILTFFLVLVIFGTAVDNRAARVGGFAIGLTVFIDILVGGPFTGAQMNPAHALSAELVNGAIDANALIYWIGPIIGGVLAAVLYKGLFLPHVLQVPTEASVSEPGLVREAESGPKADPTPGAGDE
jgi:MIP family channel proteins